MAQTLNGPNQNGKQRKILKIQRQTWFLKARSSAAKSDKLKYVAMVKLSAKWSEFCVAI